MYGMMVVVSVVCVCVLVFIEHGTGEYARKGSGFALREKRVVIGIVSNRKRNRNSIFRGIP
jgi:hypothetical protein